jgi:leader peptidase (prepilin peptidase)/N-methyltransferase
MPSDPATPVRCTEAGRSTDETMAPVPPHPLSVTGCLAAAAVVITSLVSEPNLIGALGAALGLIAVSIAVIDWRYFIIPDWLNLTGFALALLHAAVADPEAIASAVATSVVRGVVLLLIFYGLRVGYARIRGRQGLGLGDVKLAIVAGAWLDWPIIPVALQVAVLAALTGTILHRLAVGHPISASSRLPFGFFLAPSIWLGWLLQDHWLVRF